ncbi:hypothetical protein EMCRGX_G005962 [Ephydatia muelleri]
MSFLIQGVVDHQDHDQLTTDAEGSIELPEQARKDVKDRSESSPPATTKDVVKAFYHSDDSNASKMDFVSVVTAEGQPEHCQKSGLNKHRQETLERVEKNISIMQTMQKTAYDRKQCKFQVGMKVLQKNSRRCKCKGGKMDPKSLSPSLITRDLGKDVYSLVTLDQKKIVTKRINGAHLKLYTYVHHHLLTSPHHLHPLTSPHHLHPLISPHHLHPFTSPHPLHLLISPHHLHLLISPHHLHPLISPHHLHLLISPHHLHLLISPHHLRLWTKAVKTKEVN